MRYGIKATNLAEHLALAARQVPMPVVDTLLAMLQLRSIMAATRLGVWEAMAEPGAHSAAQLAQRLGLDAGCLDLLLRCLQAPGYLRRSGAGFELTDNARRWLLPGAKHDLRGSVLFCYHELKMLDSLEELIQTGRGLDFHSTLIDPEVWATYQLSMLELARGEAPHLAALVPVPAGAKLMLDVAGSHGYLGAAICRKHPPMKSLVLDLPAALPHARALARQEGITDVVEHREGDMLAGEFPGGADLVLVSNILHHFGPEQIVDILKRCYRALRPGGVMAVWDAERRSESAPPDAGGDNLALWFRLTSESQVFEDKEYVSFLEQAGFRKVRVKRSLLSPIMVCVIGEKA